MNAAGNGCLTSQNFANFWSQKLRPNEPKNVIRRTTPVCTASAEEFTRDANAIVAKTEAGAIAAAANPEKGARCRLVEKSDSAGPPAESDAKAN
jgi:hypothetical protein